MKNRRYFIAALCLLTGLLNTSCGLLHPPQRQSGYLVSHYYSCGPVAINNALRLYSKKHNVSFKREYNSKEISIEIQDSTILFDLREFLTLIDKRAAEITWPQEIKNNLKLKGISLREIKNVDELKESSDIAIILIHWKNKLTYYHWIVFPKDNLDYFGKDDTVIDRIFLLEPLKQ